MPLRRLFRRISARQLAVPAAATLTVAMVLALAWTLHVTIDRLSRVAASNNALHELHTEVVVANQKRAMALAMGLETGDEAWRRAYNEADDRLSTTIHQIVAITPDQAMMQAAADAESAHQAGLATERAALSFARSGQTERARAWLLDREYETARARFDDRLGALIDLAWAEVESKSTEARVFTRRVLSGAGLALVMVAAAWFAVFQSLARTARDLADTTARLETANAVISERSKMREASFFDDSPVPMFESDYSELRRRLLALKRDGVEDVFAWLLEHPEEVQHLAATGSTTRINPAGLALLECPNIEFWRNNRAMFYGPESVTTFCRFAASIARGDQYWSGETTLLSATGEPIHAIIHARAVRGLDDPCTSVLSSVVDITALKEAEVNAGAASRAKSEFLAAMSHEIRTPMNGVLGMAAALARTDLSDKQARMLAVIEESGASLMSILNDILDLSKIEAGKFELEHISFDLDELVHGVEALFTPRAHEKSLSFRAELAPGAHGCYLGDAARIRQILSNLISNAVKFTEEGQIIVRIERDEGDSADPGEVELVATVRDTGIGIDADTVDRLFSPFQQADASTTRRFGGTGLGLSITRQLVELMGGRILVDSTPGEGSTFTVRIPVSEWGDGVSTGPTNEVNADDVAHLDDDRPLRILAAEDNAHNRLVLRALLEPAGAETTFATDGREAVDQWRGGGFDIILMDVHMPVLDGVEATKEIRAIEAEDGLARTPILALTANAMTHQVDEYVVAGMDGHVAKPINPSTLFEAVMVALASNPVADGRAANG